MESENLLFKSLHSSSKIPETVSIPASIRIFFAFSVYFIMAVHCTNHYFLKTNFFNFNEQGGVLPKCAQGSKET